MIQLHPDYLMFELPNGDSVPCSAETVTFELIGDAVDNLDPEVVKNAAAAVLHYFQQELKRESVSVGEFSEALEDVLRGFGFKVESATTKAASPKVIETDLDRIGRESADGGDLFFFSRLQDELRNSLGRAGGRRLNLKGLRPCVKHLLKASRWSPRCERMSDHIVDYVRRWLSNEPPARDCDVIIR